MVDAIEGRDVEAHDIVAGVIRVGRVPCEEGASCGVEVADELERRRLPWPQVENGADVPLGNDEAVKVGRWSPVLKGQEVFRLCEHPRLEFASQYFSERRRIGTVVKRGEVRWLGGPVKVFSRTWVRRVPRTRRKRRILRGRHVWTRDRCFPGS